MPRRFYPALLDMTEAWREHGGARLYFAEERGEPVATALLATSPDGVAGIYNRFQYLPEMRSALDLWSTHVAGLRDRDNAEKP